MQTTMTIVTIESAATSAPKKNSSRPSTIRPRALRIISVLVLILPPQANLRSNTKDPLAPLCPNIKSKIVPHLYKSGTFPNSYSIIGKRGQTYRCMEEHIPNEKVDRQNRSPFLNWTSLSLIRLLNRRHVAEWYGVPFPRARIYPVVVAVTAAVDKEVQG